MIDENKAQIPIWLVWGLFENGNQGLMAVDLTNDIANHHRRVLKNDSRVVRAWIEQRDGNHLYGAGMIEKMSDDEMRRQIKSIAEIKNAPSEEEIVRKIILWGKKNR